MSKHQQVRTFLAIPLPAAARNALASVEHIFTVHRAALRLVTPENLHLTVRFLGSLPSDRMPDVEAAARAAAAGVPAFTLRLGSAGAFPSSRAPRVIWVGVESGPALDALRDLARRTEDELAQRGFGRETKPFAAHITLARVRDDVEPAERRAVGETLAAAAARGPVGVDVPVPEMVVMRSDLGRGAPVYTPLARAPLGR